MISEEKINSNFVLWVERLKKYNCYSEEMINEIGESLKMQVSLYLLQLVVPIMVV